MMYWDLLCGVPNMRLMESKNILGSFPVSISLTILSHVSLKSCLCVSVICFLSVISNCCRWGEGPRLPIIVSKCLYCRCRERSFLFGCTPGIFLYEMRGVVLLVASCIALVHCVGRCRWGWDCLIRRWCGVRAVVYKGTSLFCWIVV